MKSKSALNNQCNIVEYLHSPSMIPLIYITKINCNPCSVKTERTEMYMHRLSIGRKVYLAKKNYELHELIMMPDSNFP